MSTSLYVPLFLVGACLIAGWAYVRFSKFAPREIRWAILHTVAATIACQVVSPVLGSILTTGGQPELRLVFVIGIALPALAYELLTFIWLIALIQATIRRGSMS